MSAALEQFVCQVAGARTPRRQHIDTNGILAIHAFEDVYSLCRCDEEYMKIRCYRSSGGSPTATVDAIWMDTLTRSFPHRMFYSPF